jgi:branched-chain amino acid transport system permease protein
MDANRSVAINASTPASDDAHAVDRARAFMADRHRLHWFEAAPWILALVAFFLLPERMTFGTQTLIMVLFALSLDLILGYAGIVTLGHAAFFGIGAYTVALLASRYGWGEPISALLASAALAAIFGFASGWLLLRYRGLTLLVLTLSTTIMLQELGNLFPNVTGGYDGIPGLQISPLFGVFEYDLYSHTNYIYCLCVLFVLFFVVRRIVHSPFGEALAGIRENVARMDAIGSWPSIRSQRRSPALPERYSRRPTLTSRWAFSISTIRLAS